MERAIKLEIERQIDLIEDGGKVSQETRLYDGDKHHSRAMRSKEEANDYRYFPCPDLLPVVFDDAYIEQIRATSQSCRMPDKRALPHNTTFLTTMPASSVQKEIWRTFSRQPQKLAAMPN